MNQTTANIVTDTRLNWWLSNITPNMHTWPQGYSAVYTVTANYSGTLLDKVALDNQYFL